MENFGARQGQTGQRLIWTVLCLGRRARTGLRGFGRVSVVSEWTSIECRHGGRTHGTVPLSSQCQCRSHSIRGPDVTNESSFLYSTSVSANKSSDAACHCRDILASGYQGPKRRRHLCASAPLHLPRCMVRSGATDRRASGNGKLARNGACGRIALGGRPEPICPSKKSLAGLGRPVRFVLC